MTKIDRSIAIDRPVEEVRRVVHDTTTDALWLAEPVEERISARELETSLGHLDHLLEAVKEPS